VTSAGLYQNFCEIKLTVSLSINYFIQQKTLFETFSWNVLIIRVHRICKAKSGRLSAKESYYRQIKFERYF
jgi:hypothetical protein